MATLEFVTIEVPDTTAADRFYTAAFGLGTRVRLRASEAPTTGFRGFTLSLITSQPATVNGLIGTALDAGATSLKPAAKSPRPRQGRRRVCRRHRIAPAHDWQPGRALHGPRRIRLGVGMTWASKSQLDALEKHLAQRARTASRTAIR